MNSAPPAAAVDGTTAAERLELAQRYAELGLLAAARAVLARLVAEPGAVAEAHARLARLQRWRDPAAALSHGEAALSLADTAEHLLLLGQAQHAAGAGARARQTLEALLERADAGPALRCRARVSLAALAASPAARLTQLSAALDQGLLPLGLIDDIVQLARRDGLGVDLADHAAALLQRDEAPAEQTAALRWLRALLLELDDGAAAEAALRELHELPEARLSLALRLARRRGRDAEARDEAVVLLERLLERETDGEAVARLHLLLASILDDDPAQAPRACEHYELALALLPRDATAHNNLGVIALRDGESGRAREHLLRAIGADRAYESGYRNLARLLNLAGSPAAMEPTLDALLARGVDTAQLAHLCFGLVEAAREDTLRGLADRGHQLKNVLGVVASRLRSAARRADGETADQLAKLGDKLASLYEQWAAYLRAMREEVHAVETFGVGELVSEAVRRCGALAELRLADPLPEVLGVRGQVLEALINVVRNGAEAQPPGEALAVAARLGAGGRTVVVEVDDRGPGIAPVELRRIFAPGYTTKAAGSGLGLAISEQVIRAHGGRIEIESEQGAGTRVRISLPVHLESEARRDLNRLRLAYAVPPTAADEYVAEENDG